MHPQKISPPPIYLVIHDNPTNKERSRSEFISFFLRYISAKYKLRITNKTKRGSDQDIVVIFNNCNDPKIEKVLSIANKRNEGKKLIDNNPKKKTIRPNITLLTKFDMLVGSLSAIFPIKANMNGYNGGQSTIGVLS